MKHWQKRTLWVTLIVVLGLAVTPLVTRNQTTAAAAVLDYMNPLVREETVYVSPVTDTVTWHANNHGGLDYRYQVIGYDAHGHARTLQLNASDKPLANRQYLAVTIKGQVVLHWHHIKAHAIPKRAWHHLQP